MTPSIQQLLKEAGSAGRLDSEGTFTIDGKAAAGKLAAFQLPRRSAWLLKIAQAAVGSGATRLTVHQSRTAITFSFRPASALDVEETARALTSSSSITFHNAPD